ncbi:MAG: hypothetical protein HND52_15545 [Ignavibacteriae bacterium]|nr:hypothetical protein [Ignavibacteriota bacterium]NOG99370.1 hypothetical protein [Ignavibacteriota bacterium]
MFSKNHFINVTSLLAILCACLLLLNSNSNISFFFSLIFLAAAFSFLLFLDKFIFNKPRSVNSKLKIILIVSLFFITTILLYIVPQNQSELFLNALSNWLSDFFRGSYPYQPVKGFTGLPFLYFSGLPFYLTGQTILISAFGVGAILFIIYKSSKFNNEFFVRLFFISILIFLCLILNINLNPFFITAFPLLLIYLIENEYLSILTNYSIAVLAMVTGLFLSVHLISSAIIIFYLFYFLRDDFKIMLKVFSISIFVFILTLLPFAIWHWEIFLEYNPIFLQFDYLNISILLVSILIVFALFAGWMISDLQEFYFTLGMFLLCNAAYNFFDASIADSHTTSIFLYSALFLILSLKHYKVDRFLGKVLR